MEYHEKLKKNATLYNLLKKKKIILKEDKKYFGGKCIYKLKKSSDSSSDDYRVKAYPFKLVLKENNSSIDSELNLGLKIIPLDKEYNKDRHPAKLEIIFLKYFTDNIVKTRISPHIVNYLHSEQINCNSIALKNLYLKPYIKKDYIRQKGLMLVSEYINGKSLNKYMKKHASTLSLNACKYIIFSIVYTLHVLQKYYKFNHNDCHFGNILIDTTIKQTTNVYDTQFGTFYFDNHSFLTLLWDFEYGMSYNNTIKYNYPNDIITSDCVFDKKTNTYKLIDDELVVNMPYNFSEVYDIHFFLTSFLDYDIPVEIHDFIKDIYPIELISTIEDSVNKSYNTKSSYKQDYNSESTKSNTESDTDSELKSNKTSDSDSDSNSNSDSDSDSDSDSNSDTSVDSESILSITSDEDNIYLEEERLIDGVEKLFKLPTASDILSHEFFVEFKQKPEDLNELECEYFKEI
jgi:hypothetical protein